MTQTLKKRTRAALLWSFIDKGGQQLIQLLFVYVLARLLTREQFGLVALLAIFSAVANILQESGFFSALIRKKEVSNAEYSAVFYFNVAISITIYAILFVAAPLISSYYDQPILTNLARLIFLSFVFNSFGIVQNVNLVRQMDFKTNTRITLLAGVLSGSVAVAMALRGYGVWSLAVQLVIQSLVRNVLLWVFVKWKPSSQFAFVHIRHMSAYSSKMLLTGLMNQVGGTLYPLIIGKFSISLAGVYSQASKLSNIPQSVISDGIRGVAYPLLTKIEGGEQAERRAFRKVVRIAAFISFPAALILITLAKPIILILLSAKWIEAIPILQILAIGGSVYPIYCLFATLLQYKGKSGTFFWMEFVRNALLLVSILFTYKYGVIGLVVGASAVNIISFFAGFFLTARLISYTLCDILYDILPYLCLAIGVFVPVYFMHLVVANEYVLLPIQLVVGLGLYLGITKALGSKIVAECIEFVKELTPKG